MLVCIAAVKSVWLPDDAAELVVAANCGPVRIGACAMAGFVATRGVTAAFGGVASTVAIVSTGVRFAAATAPTAACPPMGACTAASTPECAAMGGSGAVFSVLFFA